MKKQTVAEMLPVSVIPSIIKLGNDSQFTVVVKGDPVKWLGAQNDRQPRQDYSVYKVLAQLEEKVLSNLFDHYELPVSISISLEPASSADAIFELVEVIDHEIANQFTIVYEFFSTAS